MEQTRRIEAKDIRVNIDVEKVLLMVDCPIGHPMFGELSQELLTLETMVKKVINPEVYIKQANLDENRSGYLVLLTLGEEISNLIANLQKEDMMQGLLANAMADQILFDMDDDMQDILHDMVTDAGFGISQRLEAPADYPLKYHKHLLKQLEEDGMLPVTLTSGMMLKPEKSMLLFLERTTDSSVFLAGHNCKNCQNDTCSYRKIGTEPERI